MKLGISAQLPHGSPEEWAQKHRDAGLEAVVFPVGYTAPVRTIDAYKAAADAAGLCIAEVGAWSNPLSPDPVKRAEAMEKCVRGLELAEYVGARCCVNISGADGEIWDAAYPGNYSPRHREALIACVRDIIDAAKPVRSAYALEPMPNMLPDSPESCLELLRDVGRDGFAVHMDLVNMMVSPRTLFANREVTDRCFSLLGKHIRSCHLKDAVIDPKLTVSIRECECGSGCVDLAHYIRRATETDPDMPMLIEHLPDTGAYMRAVRVIRGLA